MARPTKLTKDNEVFLLHDLFKKMSYGLSGKEWFRFLLLFREVFVNGKKKQLKRGIKFRDHNQYQKEYYDKVKSKNPYFRLRMAFSSLLNHHIKKNRKSTFDITEKYLGYSIEELKNHLERQFTKGMNWSNYGEWHVDHIIPASSFKYLTFEDKEFKECWSLANLQPLWAIDNLKKGNRLIWLN